MKKLLVYLLIINVFNMAQAQSKHTVTKSSLTFKIKNLGISIGGNIGGLVSNISFDKDKPESSSIDANVDANTIDTDNEMRDKHIKNEEYLDVARYPKISMKSTAIKRRSGNNYVGVFNVTIKDKTKSVDVPFTYTAEGGTARFKGSFKIQRTDFGIGSKGVALGNDVIIEIEIETSS